MFDPASFSSTAEFGRMFSRASTNVRANARRIVDAARGAVSRVRGAASRLGERAEAFVGDKIKRKVKPPIVGALVLATVALAVAIYALVRK